ncbi:MAG: Isoquinoline 1-oxidoreductase [Alphaproteobacteria bacterium HGW-Alphaproteobacteria-11]|nr:MAG: Isoquinoline 1-oxidoreductase [Alphaproteobacteria bacterium HGW-Alphaproteobacteria-11]
MRTTRRRFLAAASGITVTVALGGWTLNPIPALPPRGNPSPADALGWLRLGPDGRFAVHSPRQEIGQGISVSLRQIVAEELDISLDLVDAVLPATTGIAVARATVGSESISAFGEPLARAAAIMREALRARVADELGVAPGALAETGTGYAAGEREITFAALAGGEALLLADEGQNVTLRSFDAARERRHVGRAAVTDRIEDIVTGKPLYAADVMLPDMVYGAMLRAPRLGARLREAAAENIAEGRLLRLGRDAGIVADSFPALQRALEAAETLWDDGAGATQEAIDAAIDVDRLLARGALEHKLADGKMPPRDDWTVDLRLDIPMAAHATIEPRAAVARWNDDGPVKLDVWTGTQDAFFARSVLAREFGLKERETAVHSCRVGGAFGARGICRQEIEAARLAQAAGRPVKVQWSRMEEFQQGFHRPPSAHRVRVRVGGDGRIAEWWHAFASGHVIFTSAAMPPWLQRLTSFVTDPGVARDAVPPYAAANLRVECADIRLPVDTGPWRGLGAGPNGFAIETAIDAAARASGHDPLAFRLANIAPEHARLRRCLERVAKRAGEPLEGTLRGRGYACGIYKQVSYIAVAADVEVDAETGAARVTHMFAAHDCGVVVNPDQVRAQTEGNLVWGIGMALSEGLGIRDGRVGADHLGEYVIPTMADMPEIAIELIDEDGDAPTGAGETGIIAAAAAIGNALADATERRLTALPMTPERVRAALA